MSSKEMLTARLERELVEKINRIARQKDVSVNDLIGHAIDLVEQGDRDSESVLGRVALLEKNQQVLYDLIAVFGENLNTKFEETAVKMKEQLRHYFVIMEKQLCEHDLIEAERLQALEGRLGRPLY